jgi:hypothetical protein
MAPKALSEGSDDIDAGYALGGAGSRPAAISQRVPPISRPATRPNDAPGSSVSSRSSGIVLGTFAVARDH